MRRDKKSSSSYHSRARRPPLELCSLGALTSVIALSDVQRAVDHSGTGTKRERLLDSSLMVYYVLALSLFRNEAMTEVFRQLLEGLKLLFPLQGLEIPDRSALSKARTRLGEKPLKALFDSVVQPIAREHTRGAFYHGYRLVSIDGTTLEVYDSPANALAFGYPASSRGDTAFPQIRVAALVETATHVPFACVYDKFKVSEIVLARNLWRYLTAGMLCLADRGFTSYIDWVAASSTGASLLWRVRRDLGLRCEVLLPDGSFLSHIYPAYKDRKTHSPVVVRVIEYRLDGLPDSEPTYRLITTLLDYLRAPAHELAVLYHERWEEESVFDEIKTHLKGNWLLLRSKTPTLVRQELWGLLLTYFALRTLMHEAALKADIDPDKVSFIHTVRVVRRTMPKFVFFSAQELPLLHQLIIDEILEERVSSSRGRRNPRGVRRKMSKYPVKHRGQQMSPPKYDLKAAIVVITGTLCE